MTKTELNAIFNAHIKDHLSPKDWERADIRKKYEDLCEFVGGNCLQSGSYARFTSTTPVNDLDVIWVIPKSFISHRVIQKAGGIIDPNHLDPSDILKSLAEHLKDEYKKAGQQARIEPQSHSVGVYFGTDDEFSMDVVPAIISGETNTFGDDIYWVPQIAALSKSRRAEVYSKHEGIDWIKSDPRGYIEDARALNEANENFRRVSKFVRKWRKECKKQDKDFPLKSFHLELIVNEIFSETASMGTVEGIKEFFAKLPQYLSAPHFVDRADPSRFVDSYISTLTGSGRVKIVARINAVNATLASVDMASTPSAVAAHIKDILSSAVSAAGAAVSASRSSTPRDPGEQFLSDLRISKDLQYSLTLDAQVEQAGFRAFFLKGSNFPLKKKRKLTFTASGNFPSSSELKWKVKNHDQEARDAGDMRGEITDDKGFHTKIEHTKYTGSHYVECYAIIDGVCIAMDHLEVPIANAL